MRGSRFHFCIFIIRVWHIRQPKSAGGGPKVKMAKGSKKGVVDQRGASAVEFALLALPLLFFLLGIVQFGMTFFHWLEMEHASREGVRWASLWQPEDFVEQKIIDAAPALALDPAQHIEYSFGDPTQPGYPLDFIAAQGQPITVRITYDTPLYGYMQVIFGTGETFTLTAEATQRIE